MGAAQSVLSYTRTLWCVLRSRRRYPFDIPPACSKQVFSPHLAGFFFAWHIACLPAKKVALSLGLLTLLHARHMKWRHHRSIIGCQPGCHGEATAACYKTRMILYKPGTPFIYKGRRVTVDYIIIRKTGLWIRLAQSEEVCRPEDLTPIAPQGSDLAESGGRH